METSSRCSLGKRQAGGLASRGMASTRNRFLLKRKIEIIEVLGSICDIAGSVRILVQPLIKEVFARVFELCGGVTEVFVHRAIAAEVQHCL